MTTCSALALFALLAVSAAAQIAPASTNAVEGTTPVSAAKPLPQSTEVAQNQALWPKEVTLLKPVSFVAVFSGRVVGQTLLPAGFRLRLLDVNATQVELENQGARQWVALDSTDLMAQAARLGNAMPATQSPPPAALSARDEGQQPSQDYGAKAREVTEEIQRDFWNPRTGLYSDKPGGRDRAPAWSCGVMFSALAAAARNEPEHYQPVLKKAFEALDGYWDRKQPLGGYEPLPGGGNGNDKYYDDNEWLAIAFLEAYAVTGDPAYSKRAEQTVKFVLSGWDETYLQGGIWWHETHEKKVRCKNTCANAPAAVACLQLARISPPAAGRDLIAMARKIVDWTVANLQLQTALFADSKSIDDEGMNKAALTYNSALMVRAFLGLYHVDGNPADLRQAQRIALAANALLDQKTGVYRDHKKWAHLMVEADLALYRTTKEPYLLERARRNTDAFYEAWKKEGPRDLISAASVARVLWLMADLEKASGRDFWQRQDAPITGQP